MFRIQRRRAVSAREMSGESFEINSHAHSDNSSRSGRKHLMEGKQQKQHRTQLLSFVHYAVN
jgi:hypothetical protein